MRLTKDQVVRRFCQLATRVMSERFEDKLPADCFCGQSAPIPVGRAMLFQLLSMDDYRFDEEVLRFIERAVDAALPEV
jgi:hypothetical protein